MLAGLVPRNDAETTHPEICLAAELQRVKLLRGEIMQY